MRRLLSLLALTALTLLAAMLNGCTLTRSTPPPTPNLVTATLSARVQTETAPTLTPVPSATFTTSPVPTATDIPPTATASPIPSAVPTLGPSQTPPPTRTIPGPTALPPLDEGGGQTVPGTGSNIVAQSPVEGVSELPQTLYYLSPYGNIAQVWRLRVGLTYPDQLTYSTTGVVAFSVAPAGTLAYVSTDGMLTVGGLAVLPPGALTGPIPRVTALAWSPSGDWLATILTTPGAADALNGAHLVDGLNLRSASGSLVQLQPNNYTNDGSQRAFTGPIVWRPDGSELLTGVTTAAGASFARVNITTGEFMPLWNDSTLPPGAYTQAAWTNDGAAIIVSGADSVLQIDPDTLAARTLVGSDTGLWPEQAVQTPSGALSFISHPPGGLAQLHRVQPGQAPPAPISNGLTPTGKVETLWDSTGQQVIIVVHDTLDSLLGTAFLRDAAGLLHELTPLTGTMGSPQWGPMFKPGDTARVRTTDGDPLNLRESPGGSVIQGLPDGTRVFVMEGPRTASGYRWWRVQTASGIAGWAVDSVTDERGQPLRTLNPAD